MDIMDPLGAHCSTIDVLSLASWNETTACEYDTHLLDTARTKESPFPWDSELNQKIVLWHGDITELNAEAIVNSTNESMSDRNPLTERIMSKAGLELKKEIRMIVKSCKTGEAKLTKGYKLPARHIIHTVGPRYNVRYKTAAESALYCSYRSVLQLMREKNLMTLGICCIHSPRRGYPAYEGAHIAIRTVRRFLEKHGSTIERIVFVVTPEEKDVYAALLPLYFPRSRDEERFAAWHMPSDVGNADGEPVIEERQIRIMSKPTLPVGDLEESVNINDVFATSVIVGAHSFSKMEGDLDRQRQRQRNGRSNADALLLRVQQQKRYERWLRRCREEDLSELAQLHWLYHSGFDKHGRPVVVFVAKNLPFNSLDPQKVLLYFIHLMDPIVKKKYVFVYVHTLTPKHQQPDSTFLKDMCNILDSRYKDNLSAVYIVHPTFWSKVMTWFFTTFNMSWLKQRVQHMPGLEYLYSRIDTDQLDLPQFVTDYDIQINGSRYYDPDTDDALGAL